jgi:hypothetical protein
MTVNKAVLIFPFIGFSLIAAGCSVNWFIMRGVEEGKDYEFAEAAFKANE